MIIKIPQKFAWDHSMERLLPSGQLIEWTARFGVFDVDKLDLQSWKESAEYYADLDRWKNEDWFKNGGRAICLSAKAALKRISKVEEVA